MSAHHWRRSWRAARLLREGLWLRSEAVAEVGLHSLLVALERLALRDAGEASRS